MILSGGAGTRLWPVSRQTFPKQLLPIGSDGTMLQETAQRVAGEAFAPALVIGGEEHGFFLKRQLEEASVPVAAIILEPAGRNTSAAAAAAAQWTISNGEDEILLLVPADHVIGNADAFHRAIQAGLPSAAAGAIVTFGALPTEPNTQYGYIEVSADRPREGEALPIVRFVEKPDQTTAEEFVKSGRFFWNSGIFMAKASTLLEQMRRFLPESLEAIVAGVEQAGGEGIFLRLAPDAFLKAQDISIDHGIMEKTDRGVVIPVDMDWSDVGSWAAVWQRAARDESNNAEQGRVVAVDTTNSLLRNDGNAVVAAIGLNDMAVIAVRDAVLVAPLSRVGEAKRIVEALHEREDDRAVSPSKVERPWGSYETMDSGPGFQVKRITVRPGESLSLQLHHRRSEHWVVVSGTAEVTVGEQVSLLRENDSTYIPVRTRHRLTNPGEQPLELIEVQCGDYLGEDDIVRFDDRYGRAK